MDVDVRGVPPADREPLVRLWRRAVEATHHFLSADDVDFYHGVVAGHLAVAGDVRAAYDGHGRPVGFIAQDGGEIEMLFVEPEVHGRGVGGRLLESVARDHDELLVDVNEQNPSGRRFYEAKGFVQIGRSELDPSGRPFPLLRLRRGGAEQREGRLVLPDGRILGYAQYGPADGTPVVFVPGAGCGRLMTFGEELLHRRRVRLLSVDRPGLGVSTADPEKSFARVGADVTRLVEDVVGHPVPLVANSQGAPFGLAVAAAGGASAVVLVSPIDDMAHPPVRALLPDDYRTVIDEVDTDAAGMFTVFSNATAEQLMDMVLRNHPACDAPVYGDPGFLARFSAALSDGLRSGAGGYAQDTVLAMTAWPAELFTATVPAAVLMGAEDHAHSPDRGATLAERLGATRTVVDGVGGSLLWARPELVLDALEAIRPRAGSAG